MRPGSRVHDEILPPDALSEAPVRPTNNAGGLEGGVTNGQDVRVTGFMKPIATPMNPLRSVDLTTMQNAPAAIERSDVCAVPAAAVVGEAMVSFVLADAFLEKFGGDSVDEIAGHYAATAARVAQRFGRARPSAAPAETRSRDDPADPPLRSRPAAPRVGPGSEITPEIQQIIDDTDQDDAARPASDGGAADWRPAAHLRGRHQRRP